MKYYRQCTFKQDKKITTAWIEEKGAKVGLEMKFKDEDDDEFWEVIAVGSTRITEKAAKLQEVAFKHQRKMSDI